MNTRQAVANTEGTTACGWLDGWATPQWRTAVRSVGASAATAQCQPQRARAAYSTLAGSDGAAPLPCGLAAGFFGFGRGAGGRGLAAPGVGWGRCRRRRAEGRGVWRAGVCCTCAGCVRARRYFYPRRHSFTPSCELVKISFQIHTTIVNAVGRSATLAEAFPPPGDLGVPRHLHSGGWPPVAVRERGRGRPSECR